MISYQRGYGHIPNRPHVLGAPIWELHQRLRSGALRPTSFANSHLWGAINDQSITSSCTAQGTTKQAFLRGRRMFLTGLLAAELPELSAPYTYGNTRARTMIRGEAFVDAGAMPGDAYLSAAEVGFVSAARLPFAPETVNDPLPPDTFAAGVDAKLTAYHSIFEEDDAKLDAIDESIYLVGGVGFAMPVDAAFERLEDQSVYQGISGPILGYHWQVIVDYTPDYYVVGGSWGIEFGYGGFVRVARSFVRSRMCTDLSVLDVAPGGVT